MGAVQELNRPLSVQYYGFKASFGGEELKRACATLSGALVGGKPKVGFLLAAPVLRWGRPAAAAAAATPTAAAAAAAVTRHVNSSSGYGPARGRSWAQAAAAVQLSIAPLSNTTSLFEQRIHACVGHECIVTTMVTINHTLQGYLLMPPPRLPPASSHW